MAFIERRGMRNAAIRAAHAATEERLQEAKRINGGGIRRGPPRASLELNPLLLTDGAYWNLSMDREGGA